ncbi:MAG: aldo/keto reductase [Acidimicrobiia bacterium]|nr:aldo/keto reductase [Acidimicrobiia bacterium]
MHYIALGRSGLKVSRICLGCMGLGTSTWREWALDEEPSRAIIRRALDLGINFFDTADMYSAGASEEVVGRALGDFGRRDQVVIATKAFYPTGTGPNDRGLSRKHLFDAIDASLRRLGTDYVDLYQVHRWDPATPIDETLRALDDIVRAGKARYIGASSCWAWEFAQALALADSRGWSRFISMQNHYNLVYREEEREMIPLCRKEGIGLIPWSPLARGVLVGTRTRDGASATLRAKTDKLAHRLYTADGDFAIAERCRTVAERRGVPPAQVALAWLYAKGVTAPILGTTKPENLDTAVGAIDLTLEAEEVRFLEELYTPHPEMGIDLAPRV